MEFYKQAISIRKTITTWLLKDFNTKPNKKSIKMIIKDLDEEDEKILNEVFAKYGKTPNQVFQSGYPQWFVDYERGIISMVPAKKAFITERRKLKKLADRLPKEELENQYKGWRGSLVKFDCHRRLIETDRIKKQILKSGTPPPKSDTQRVP